MRPFSGNVTACISVVPIIPGTTLRHQRVPIAQLVPIGLGADHSRGRGRPAARCQNRHGDRYASALSAREGKPLVLQLGDLALENGDVFAQFARYALAQPGRS